MVKTLLSFCLCVSASLLFAQAPGIQWQKSMGGSADEYARSIAATADSGYIVAGYTTSNDSDVSGNHGAADFWVVKLSASGALQWQKCYGGSNDEKAFSIHQTTDHGYIVAGFSESTDGQVTGHHGGADTADCWVIKTDSVGGIVWEHAYGGSDYDGASSIIQVTDGGYMLAGYTQSDDGDVSGNKGASDFWVLKLSASGNLQWQKTFGGSSFDNAADIQQTTDQGYIVTGNTYSSDSDVTVNHGVSDDWLIKLDTAGNLAWEKSYGGSANEGAEHVRQTPDGGYILSGTTMSTDGDVDIHFAVPELWLIKTDAAGIIQWKKTYGGQGSEATAFATPTTDGGYIVSCGSGSTDGDVTGCHGVLDIWVLKLDAAGAIEWEKCYGGPWFEGAAEIYPATGGGYIACGQSMSTGGDVTSCKGGYDFWVLRLDQAIAVPEIDQQLAVTVAPNPFTQSSVITFTHTKSDDMQFDLYDCFGKLVFSQTNILTDHLNISRGDLSRGLYFFRLQSATGNMGTGTLVIE